MHTKARQPSDGRKSAMLPVIDEGVQPMVAASAHCDTGGLAASLVGFGIVLSFLSLTAIDRAGSLNFLEVAEHFGIAICMRNAPEGAGPSGGRRLWQSGDNFLGLGLHRHGTFHPLGWSGCLVSGFHVRLIKEHTRSSSLP